MCRARMWRRRTLPGLTLPIMRLAVPAGQTRKQKKHMPLRRIMPEKARSARCFRHRYRKSWQKRSLKRFAARSVRFCMQETASASPMRLTRSWKWQTDSAFRLWSAGTQMTACTMTVRGMWADRATWATARATLPCRTVTWYSPWEAA